MAKLVPKIILEGTRLTHKTDLAFALNEHPRIVGPRKYRYHSPLISAEWCAFTNFPWGRGLINYEPDEEPLAIETYATWLRLFELQRYYSWIIDRWHLSTLSYQNFHGRDVDLDWLDEGLRRLGFHLVLCVRQPDTFEQAREERLRISGNPGQYDDMQVFIEEQARLRQLSQRSSLPILELDVSDGDLERMCGNVADWMEERGGLFLPD